MCRCGMNDPETIRQKATLKNRKDHSQGKDYTCATSPDIHSGTKALSRVSDGKRKIIRPDWEQQRACSARPMRLFAASSRLIQRYYRAGSNFANNVS